MIQIQVTDFFIQNHHPGTRLRNAEHLLANLQGLDAMEEAETLGYNFSMANTNDGIRQGVDSLTAMLELGEAEDVEREEQEVEEELMYSWDEEYGEEEEN